MVGAGSAHPSLDPIYYMEAFALAPPNFLTFNLCMLTNSKKMCRSDNSKGSKGVRLQKE